MDTAVLEPSPTPATVGRTTSRAAARGAVAAGLGLLLPDPLAPLLLGLTAAATAVVDRALLLAVLEERTTPILGALAASAGAAALLVGALLHGALGLSPGDPASQTTALAAALDRLAGGELVLQALAWLVLALLLATPFGLRLLTDELAARGSTAAALRRNGRWLEATFALVGLLTALLAALAALATGLPMDDERQAAAILNIALAPVVAGSAHIGLVVALHLVDGLTDLAVGRLVAPSPRA